MTKSTLSDLIYTVNGAAIEVHKSLGPGWLESVYIINASKKNLH